MGLNIAFFGSSILSAFWNGAATYYRGLVRALHQRGHHVTFYEPDAYDRHKHQDIHKPEWANVVIYTAKFEKDISEIVHQASDVDLVIKASGVGVFDDVLERKVLELQTSNTLVVFWDVDAPATLDRIEKNAQDPFRELIPQYDLIFTYGGGEPVIDAYKKWGARDCVPIYNALDPTTHYPVEPDPVFKSDLAFLGNRLPDREVRVDEFFLKVAQSLPQRRFVLGGSGWADKSRSSNVHYLGHVYTHKHNAFNCTPHAVLNINRASMAHYGFSPPTRVFEAAGAGACLITDYWEGIDLFLKPGEEVLVAKDGEEVSNHLVSLTEDKARKIGKAALQRILSEHTYDHRAALFESVLKEKFLR
jgi:spore maturation protein CgeB